MLTLKPREQSGPDWTDPEFLPSITVLRFSSFNPATRQIDAERYIERFNRTCQTEVLDRYIFNTLTDVRSMTEDWRRRYNEERPHAALGDVPPARYDMSQ